jgi:hypothetical protein
VLKYPHSAGPLLAADVIEDDLELDALSLLEDISVRDVARVHENIGAGATVKANEAETPAI